MRIDYSDDDHILDPSVVDLKKKIAEINTKIEEEGFQLLLTESEDAHDERTKRHKIHLQSTNESLFILSAFDDKSDSTRVDNVLQCVEKSRALIDKQGDEFYKFHRGWRNMNELMIQKSSPVKHVEFVLSNRGFKITKMSLASLYLFLQCEEIDCLDVLWEEYTSGQLLRELENIADLPSKVSFTIVEENYTGYRDYLSKCLI